MLSPYKNRKCSLYIDESEKNKLFILFGEKMNGNRKLQQLFLFLPQRSTQISKCYFLLKTNVQTNYQNNDKINLFRQSRFVN